MEYSVRLTPNITHPSIISVALPRAASAYVLTETVDVRRQGNLHDVNVQWRHLQLLLHTATHGFRHVIVMIEIQMYEPKK